jgi:hypothetical protein
VSGVTVEQHAFQTHPWRTGDRVQVQHQGRVRRGRISSIHRVRGGVEYVVHLDAEDDRMGQILNVAQGCCSERSSALTPVRGAR